MRIVMAATCHTCKHVQCTQAAAPYLPQDEDTQRLSTLRQRAGELKLWATWQDLPQELVDPMFRWQGSWELQGDFVQLGSGAVAYHLQPGKPVLAGGNLMPTPQLRVKQACSIDSRPQGAMPGWCKPWR